MIGRRRLLTGGGVLGAVLLPAEAGAQSSTAQMSERQAQEILQAVKEIRGAIDAPNSFTEIAAVRGRLVEYLKLQGKFPDYIEVGVDIWMAAYDWHVRQRQPMTVERDANGRYNLVLMATRLILRQEAAPNLIGTPFDNR